MVIRINVGYSIDLDVEENMEIGELFLPAKERLTLTSNLTYIYI